MVYTFVRTKKKEATTNISDNGKITSEMEKANVFSTMAIYMWVNGREAKDMVTAITFIEKANAIKASGKTI